MSKINSLLNERCSQKEAPSKMQSLATQSSRGQLSSFSGVFGHTELDEGEKQSLKVLLERYAVTEDIQEDLQSLIHLTSEIKAINNQAALLHGERIKHAQGLLKEYKEGAFTAWLYATYGNRQTPYNLLKYYEFYQSVPLALRSRLESMPRQAIYSLASREGSLEEKIRLVEAYQGETKLELLEQIRTLFPLAEHDKRKQNLGEHTKQTLNTLCLQLGKHKPCFSPEEKKQLRKLISKLQNLL